MSLRDASRIFVNLAGQFPILRSMFNSLKNNLLLHLF